MLAVDSSTPVRATASTNNNSNVISTGAFNPPAGSLLVATVQMNTRQAWPVTGIMTNNGAAQTWTLRAERSSADFGGLRGYAGIFTTPLVAARTGMTVTFTGSSVNGTFELDSASIKLYVVTDAAATQNGVNNEGSTTDNELTTPLFAVTRYRSMGFISASEWNVLGAPTSATMVVDSISNGQVSITAGYKMIDSGGSLDSLNVDAPGTSLAEWNWAMAEILPTEVVVPTSGNSDAMEAMGVF